MIKVIAFDWGGVCAHESSTLSHPVFIDKKKIRHEMSILYDDLYTGKIAEKELWQHILKNYNLPGVDNEELWQAYSSNYTINNHIIQLIEQLKKRNIRLVLWSNLSLRMAQHIVKKHNLNNLFEKTFFSSQIHQMKPNNEFYRIATSDLGVLPNEILFIDDNIQNINAAKAFGIQTITYTTTDDLKKEIENKIKG